LISAVHLFLVRDGQVLLQVVGVMHFKGSDERINFFLTAQAWTNEPRICEPERCDELAWYPLDHLPTNMVPYVRQALENYRAERWFDSFGWK
jgi:8-oxo-dGTP diphosphatase